MFAQFLALLREYGMTHRGIAFYTERLALTPNHLSAVVRQQSGISVMDWINRTTVMEAKILLKHSTLMVYEIADRLCFSEPTAFNRYLKKQTGITPLEYRENQ
ncbi:MAG: AraC family transcriptional regulator [Prevotella sp.]|nr:AraC family transcriptional regulator [Prevotella sp.]MBQ9237383.1 AraC family transcriptional regulator [Prevotella sp.]MBR1839217.1 AraC family transcriptional regulator [Prevotella sp.]